MIALIALIAQNYMTLRNEITLTVFLTKTKLPNVNNWKTLCRNVIVRRY